MRERRELGETQLSASFNMEIDIALVPVFNNNWLVPVFHNTLPSS